MYYNDGTKLVEWNMTREIFDELFPLGKRNIYIQNNGTCYFASTLISFMSNNELRCDIYKMFSVDESGNVIVKTATGQKVNFSGTTLKDVTSSKGWTIDTTCKGFQMLEEVWALSKAETKSTPSKINLDDIDGGLELAVISTLFGYVLKQEDITKTDICGTGNCVYTTIKSKSDFDEFSNQYYSKSGKSLRKFPVNIRIKFPGDEFRHALSLVSYYDDTGLVKLSNTQRIEGAGAMKYILINIDDLVKNYKVKIIYIVKNKE